MQSGRLGSVQMPTPGKSVDLDGKLVSGEEVVQPEGGTRVDIRKQVAPLVVLRVVAPSDVGRGVV